MYVSVYTTLFYIAVVIRMAGQCAALSSWGSLVVAKAAEMVDETRDRHIHLRALDSRLSCLRQADREGVATPSA